MGRFLILAPLLLSGCTHLVLHTNAVHYPKRDYNNATYGVGVGIHHKNEVGVYRNSYKQTSVYYAREFTRFGPLSLNASIASGYPKSETVLPLIGYRKGFQRAMCMPGPLFNKDLACLFSWEVPL